MHRARVASSGRIVERGHIGPPRQFSGDLICWKCSVPVTAVEGHMRRGAPVRALFRLAARRAHEEACPLNPVTVTDRIARGARRR